MGEEQREGTPELQEVEQLEGTIHSFADYRNAVGQQSKQTQEDLQKLMGDLKLLKECIVAQAAIQVEMTARGIATNVNNKVTSMRKSFSSAVNAARTRVADMRKNVISRAGEIRDGVIETAQGVRDSVIETAHDVRDGVVESFEGYKQNVREGMEDIHQSELEEEFFTATAAGAANAADSKWANEKKASGRNEVVADSVQSVKETSRNIRAGIALKSVKVAGFIGKGLVLVGQKGLAQSMMQRVSQRNEKFVLRESRVGKLMQRVAEAGYTTADGVRSARDAVEKGAKAVGRGVVRGADAVRKGAIQGAISLGEGTYKTVGTVAGAVSFAALGAIDVGRTMGRAGRKLVKDKIVDPAREARDNVVEFAKKVQDRGSKYWDLGKKIVDHVQDVPTSLQLRAKQMLLTTADRINVDENKKKQMRERAKAVEKSKEALRGDKTVRNNDAAEPSLG